MDTIGLIKQRLEILYEMVENLEREGGGGGGQGGTDNYNDLSNKPQINSITLSGNKSLADLGIAAAGSAYTKSEVNDLLDDKADKSDTYTKTQTDAEIQGAITELDVSSTSATGHYIKSIEQIDGKISAVAELVDTTPMPASTHPITSDAVYTVQSNLTTAVNGKAALTDVFGMGNVLQPTQEAPVDMNDITNIGTYTCSATYIADLANRPELKTGVNLYFEVRRFTTTRWMQIAYYQSNDADCFYIRWKTVNSWTSWYKFVDTNATVYGTSLSIDPAVDTTLALADLAPGRYRITSSAAAGRVSDTPWTSSGFEIVVHNTSSSSYRVQTLYPALDANAGDKYYQRHYRGTGSGAANGWSPWYLYEGTVVS